MNGKKRPVDLRRRRLMAGAAAAGASLWLPGCGSGDEDTSPGPSATNGVFHLPRSDFSADVRSDGRIMLRRGGKAVTSIGANGTAPGPGLTWRRVVHTAENIKIGKQLAPEKYGEAGLFLNRQFFHTRALKPSRQSAGRIFNISRTDNGVAVVLASSDNGFAMVEISGVRLGIVKVSLSAPSGANEIAQSLPCAADERFYGLGGQTWTSQHRGAKVPMWTVPNGEGKAASKAELDPFQLKGLPYDAYTPIPWYFSSAGYGVSLDTFHRSILEMATEEHPRAVRLRTWGGAAAFYLFAGETPKKLVSAYTSIAGRHTAMPPDWFFAPHNDAVRGSANVRRVANKLREHHIPTSVIWTEDWAGGAQNATGFRLAQAWQASHELYPDFTRLASDLHDAGYRFLGYFAHFVPNPENTPGFNQKRFQTALKNGYTFNRAGGDPYAMLTPPFLPPPGYAVDWTDDEAVKWYQGYVRRAARAGLDGAMVDYGEWVPYSAHFQNGATAATEHNRYPLRWQSANREIWDRLRPDGDYLFYVRSGYTGMQKNVPAVWGGDQNTNWSRVDGMASVITMGINLGLSGVSFFGSDIGGYASYPDAYPDLWHGVTTKELFLRWAALGAYSPMMRTHHGSKYGENWSWEGAPNPDNPKVPIPDPETVRIYKHWATQHIRLFPYMKAFARQSLDTGLPMMRHMILENPEDKVVQGDLPDAFSEFSAKGKQPGGELFQYYLGDSLLVAPIIDQGSTRRPVYLPAGAWYRIETGKRFKGPTTLNAHAALNEIPVFAPGGAIIPRLPPRGGDIGADRRSDNPRPNRCRRRNGAGCLFRRRRFLNARGWDPLRAHRGGAAGRAR